MGNKRPFVEFILKLINFMFSLCGLALMLYGLYCLANWKRSQRFIQPAHPDHTAVKYDMGRRLLLSIPSSEVGFPTAWFIYFEISIGATLFIISCFGYVGAASRSSCCLISHSLFLLGLVLGEIGIAAFIIFVYKWEEVVQRVRSVNFPVIYHFLKINWITIRWFALAGVFLQAISMFSALYLLSVVSKAACYDSSDDDEGLNYLSK